ncbi:MAG TPA: response regulator [Terriglobia bacterium]|nr:response regulator [Terriglobia bacterium]
MSETVSMETQVADYRGCVVLIYSSDRPFLDYYRTMFLSLGFSPVTATTSQAAKGILRLAIIVYMVVDLDEGLQTSRELIHYARRTQCHAPVVVMSRKPDQDTQPEARDLGATDYLAHPALMDEMVQALLPRDASA